MSDVNNQPGTSSVEENDESREVTLAEILAQHQELNDKYEEEYIEIFGGSDDKNCSYSQGYVKRQALYACLTCTPDARSDPTKRAGVCLACSYNCHYGHEMIELCTKRNFRCDCGTAKIIAVRCKLDAVKLEQNDKNSYNQNFSGLYCICHRPYPDPEDSIDDEMVQCVLCEDWFHFRHLQAKVPKSNNFAEMICGDCMEKNEFLYHYTGMSITTVAKSELNTSNTSRGMEHSMIEETATMPEEKVYESLKVEINQSIMDINEINKSYSESNDELPSKKQKIETAGSSSEQPICKKPQLVSEKTTGAKFWPIDWRKNVCACVDCLKNMKELKVEFLTDLEDTVQSYQEKGLRESHETIEERGMREFSRIDRQQQINILTRFNELEVNLKEFLEDYAINNITVTKDDITRFFRMMNDKEGK